MFLASLCLWTRIYNYSMIKRAVYQPRQPSVKCVYVCVTSIHNSHQSTEEHEHRDQKHREGMISGSPNAKYKPSVIRKDRPQRAGECPQKGWVVECKTHVQ